jgi:two-component system LytT family response regulator
MDGSEPHLRVLIVDDEPLPREYLQGLLAADPRVSVVAACAKVDEARTAIAELDPDAIFIDIEMPGASGLDLAREADAAGRPLVVFVTAHQKYAIDAFDAAPVDYLLKPADPLRCRRAVTRLGRVVAARDAAHEKPHRPVAAYLKRLFVKNDERLVHVPVEEIDAVEALGNYVKLRVQKTAYVLRASISALESRLDPAMFVRTHRSFIVNVTRIRELVPVSHGDYRIVLDRSVSVPLSRVYRDRLQLFVLSAAGEPA